MPSPRRLKIIAVAAVTAFLILIYYNVSYSGRNAVKGETYMQTMYKAALDRENRNPSMESRLRAAEDAAKKAADAKAGPKPDSPRSVERVMKGRLEKDRKVPAAEEVLVGPAEQDYDALEDLAGILRRSPIIIFSKTYCPHSLDAKNLFLHEYLIVPAPFVVELDTLAHGAELQDELEKRTGRRTVPNIMISGKSIGGNDDVQRLEMEGRLSDTIHKMGGKRIMRMLKRKND